MKLHKIVFYTCFFIYQTMLIICCFLEQLDELPDFIYITWIVASTVILSISVLELIQAGREILQDARTESEFTALCVQNQLQQKQAADMRQKHSNTIQFQDNMKNELRQLQTYLRKGQYSDAKSYFDNICLDFEKVRYRPRCADSLINAILESKYQYATEHEILVNYQIVLSTDRSWDSPDISCVFFNLLDNGIEACIRSGQDTPYINLTARSKDEFLSIHMVNSKNSEEDSTLQTSETGFSEHGYGLQIIEHIVQKCDGYCEWEDCGDTYESSVLLRGFINH